MFHGIINQEPVLLSHIQAVLISYSGGGVADKVTFGWCGNKIWS